MKIYFDMDGVLADFDGGLRELCGIPVTGRYGERTKEEDRLLWDSVSKVDHYYGKLKPLPGALEMFATIYDRYGQQCEILTGIPKPERGITSAAEDKIDWVARYLSPDIRVNIVFRREKMNYCTGSDCILIDDLEETIDQWRKHGGIGILHRDAESTLRELKTMGILK